MSIARYAIAVYLFSTLIAGCSGGGSGPSQPSVTATPVATAKPTATPTVAPTASPSPFSTGPVTVMESSATNVHGFTIVLQQNATAVVTQNSVTESPVPVPSADSEHFFTDLNANSPITNVATYGSNCAKSASFGTTTTLTYGGFGPSGDISCPGPAGSAANALYADEQTIKTDISNADPNAFNN